MLALSENFALIHVGCIMFEGVTTDEPLIRDHTKESVVAYGSWLLTKMEPGGVYTNRPHHASDGRLQRL